MKKQHRLVSVIKTAFDSKIDIATFNVSMLRFGRYDPYDEIRDVDGYHPDDKWLFIYTVYLLDINGNTVARVAEMKEHDSQLNIIIPGPWIDAIEDALDIIEGRMRAILAEAQRENQQRLADLASDFNLYHSCKE